MPLPVPPPRVSLRQITKTIGAHRILSGVSIELTPGEIHVLVGANGAGKSTLIRILSGADKDFQGEVWLDSEKLALASPREGQRAGIHVIYQELSLVNCLSAVDNWVLSEERQAFSWLSRTEARARVLEQCRRFELEVDVDGPVERLTLSERQLLEIARALSGQAKVLVLDEPTSALSETDAARLLTQLERLRGEDTAILYVSHRMEEIYQIADRISVLRDGVLVLTRPARELSRDELIRAMVGKGAEFLEASSDGRLAISTQSGRAQLAVRGLSVHGSPGLVDANFEASSREILGVCGLSGSGASELLEVLGGARQRSSGTVAWEGRGMYFATPQYAFAAGFAFLPADRKESVFPGLSLLDNASLSALGRFSRIGLVQRHDRRQEVERLAKTMALQQYSLDAEAGSLSGGNQQKLALLRCLAAEPRVLLLAEPTRGVDVAAKDAIHRRVREIAGAGLLVLLQSSELDELILLCERVLVMHQGRLVATLGRQELNRERLLSCMMGHFA